ncbi:ABC transporter permease subunit [Halomicrobium urmianum]|uniref:ABC transporter permease subunit n=1 Tax=Halomicrobium urmianum TaxID=1586233 RepID=UPI001CD9CAD6|nr:ABC transporter permease subunit [Halomicrobium urmianum]
MFEVTRYDARRRVRGTAALTVGLSAFALLIVGVYPSIATSGVDFEAYVENLPEAFRSGFGVEAFNTVEGFLAAEFYQFVWVLLLGLYVAYQAGGSVAGDVEDGRLDLVLATPISRSRLLVEKFLAVLTPVVALNLVMPLVVYAGLLAVEESIDFGLLIAVHVLSVPYLLACAAAGLLLSVLVSRGDLAERGALAGVFLLFVVDSVTTETDVEWLGAVSPTRYYDPTEILVRETFDVGGAIVLFAAAFLLFAVGRARFLRRDV